MQAVKEQQSLTREQKEAVGLLSIGTFLEYFDLMLYVHMAVLLNELFFPKTDAHTAMLITAFSCFSLDLLCRLQVYLSSDYSLSIYLVVGALLCLEMQ